jgi:hypothetical protein
MKLITELTEQVEYLEESKKDGGKNLFITGPFMQYETPNRNGRIYPKNVMEKEVNRYKSEVMENSRAYGELNHPEGPTINLDRVCILIKELNMENDKKVYGKALVTETPSGNIVRGLMSSGANLGVSTRGLGSLKSRDDGINEVQDDFRLVTAADVVADPSAPAAFVKGIMENVEYFYNDKTGQFCEDVRQVVRRLSKRQIEERQTIFFENFLSRL